VVKVISDSILSYAENYIPRTPVQL